MKYDMHIHTTYSDGEFAPERVIELAVEKKLDGIAITDHDSISAINVAESYIKSKNYKIELIPGIEFGTNYNSDEVHILGYFIDYNNEELIKCLNQLNKWRFERSDAILKELNKQGFKLSSKDIISLDSNFTGRVDIAKAMVRKGYVDNISEAFESYLGAGKSCYVPKKTYSIKKVIEVIKDAGGISILAHPILLKDYNTLLYVVESGIDGLECIHSKQTIPDTLSLINYSEENNLLISGGSDCHGRLENNNKNFMIGEYYVTSNQIEEMRKIKNGR